MARVSGVSLSTGACSVVIRYAVSATEPLKTAVKRAEERSERSSWSAYAISAVDWFLMPFLSRRHGEGGMVLSGPVAVLEVGSAM